MRRLFLSMIGQELALCSIAPSAIKTDGTTPRQAGSNEMEPQAKRLRLDHQPLGSPVERETSNEARAESSNRHVSSHFGGAGVSNPNGHFTVGRDLIVHPGKQPDIINASNIEQILESLRFEQIDARQSTIKKAHADTCKWFTKASVFERWNDRGVMHNGTNFLWIKGKPGAGKSTLMKYLLKSMNQRTSKDVIISFFFNARGGELEKSTRGMYRSLLYQLLSSRPELQHILGRTGLGAEWQTQKLKTLFEEAVEALEDTSVTCFIDALDECDQAQIEDLIGFLDDLTEEGTGLYVCFASRHYPQIIVRTELSIILEERDEHENDISTYLSKALRIGHSKLAEQIRLEVREKAHGVFMWVVLIVGILNKEHAKGRMHTMRQQLRLLPGDLHELFRDILTRDSNNQEGLLLCVQWILFAKEPLTPQELYFAIISGLAPEHLAGCHTEDYTEEVWHKYILDNSKGLAEVTKSKKKPTFQFIHESVRDFLLKDDGLAKVFPHLGSNIHGPSHEALRSCCSTYIRMTIEAENIPDEGKVAAEFPLLRYAVHGVLYHADQAQSNGVNQRDFLTDFRRDTWLSLYNIVQKYETRRYRSQVSKLYILAEADTPALIRALPARQSCFQVEHQRYGLPILAAIAAGSHKSALEMLEIQAEIIPRFSLSDHFGYPPLVWSKAPPGRGFTFDKKGNILEQLIAYGTDMVSSIYFLTEGLILNANHDRGEEILVDVGGENPTRVMPLSDLRASSTNVDGDTLLHLASAHDHSNLAKLLLDLGADVSATNKAGLRPLHRSSKSYRVTKLLISHGADVSATLDDSQTPLHLACSHGSVKVFELLIAHGADMWAMDCSGRTPLHIACLRRQVEMVKLLITYTSESSSTDHSDSVSGDKCSDSSNRVPKLSDLRMKLSVADNKGHTPLHIAAGHADKSISELLIDGGADVLAVTQNGDTPLHEAVTGNGLETAKLLIDAGANISARNVMGQTPLCRSTPDFLVLNPVRAEVVELLLDCGADVLVKDNDGNTALHHATNDFLTIEAVMVFLERGANVSSRNVAGQTPLHLALSENELSLAKAFVDHGADTAAIDHQGRTPLDMASKAVSSDFKEFLLARKAKRVQEPIYQSHSAQ